MLGALASGIALAVATLPIAHARQSAARTVHVEGVVVDALTEQPVRGAVVIAKMLETGGTSAGTVKFLTGADGRFVFRDWRQAIPCSSARRPGF